MERDCILRLDKMDEYSGKLFYSPLYGFSNQRKEGFVPVFSNPNDFFKEQWWVNETEHTVCNFYYPSEEMISGSVEGVRASYFDRINVKPQRIRYIAIPESVFDIIVEELTRNGRSDQSNIGSFDRSNPGNS